MTSPDPVDRASGELDCSAFVNRLVRQAGQET